MDRGLVSADQFFILMCQNGFYTKPERLKFLLENHLFKGIDLRGKRVLDIGGGNGLYGYYALINGAKDVVIMEPEFAGCSNGMIKEFGQIHELLGKPSGIRLERCTIQEYSHEGDKFDVVLMANSINHFDELSCIDLHYNTDSQVKYRDIFSRISGITSEKSKLILTDCTNRNFFHRVGVINPFMPTIEWEKHQPPEVWASFLKEVGFVRPRVDWSSPNSLGFLGRFILGNRIANYFTLGHFRLEMTKDE